MMPSAAKQGLLIPVAVSLVLDDQILLMDRLQESSGERLEVGDGLRRGW